MSNRATESRSRAGGLVCASFMLVGATTTAALIACSSSPHASSSGHDAGHPDASRAVVDAGVDAALAVSAACEAMLQPPPSIECTGLYTDVAAKTLAPEVRAYAPAIPLWADGSGKLRWIYFPPGTVIDASDPNEWTFPVGTRVWKEFSRDGRRMETRFFEKLSADAWAYGTYQWSSDESTATLSPGANLPLPDGGTYQIPTVSECAECHNGRRDYLMGFEQVSLGLSGATGLTLEELASEGLLSPAPASTHLVVGDDGTGHAAAALSWLHINCGVSCHNTDSRATESSLGMMLRLDPTQLDGRPSNDFPSITTTVGVPGQLFPGTRIVAGDPGASLIHQLIDERGAIQMPPIASLLVDTPDVATVGQWIAAMPAAPKRDAGTDAARPPKDAEADRREPQKDAEADRHEPPKDAEADRHEPPKDAEADRHEPEKDAEADRHEPEKDAEADRREPEKDAEADRHEPPKDAAAADSTARHDAGDAAPARDGHTD